MSLTTSEMTPADIRACTCGNDGYGNGGDMWGGNAWWIIILLIFGWGGYGGFGGGYGGGNALQGALTRADLCQDMNFSQMENGIRGIQQGICDSSYALNTSILNGFHGVDNAICTLGYQNAQLVNGVNNNVMQGFNAANVVALQNQNALQTQLADCCCTTQRAIDGVNYNMAANTCALQNTANMNTRDIIDNANSNTRAILDYLCQDKISSLQNEVQTLRLAASQSDQNNFIAANQAAQTAEIIRRLGADCPQPTFLVQPPTPVSFATNCSGQAVFSNNGCGCNSGCCGNNF